MPVVALMLTGAADMASLAAPDPSGLPPAGRYVTVAGERFDVSTIGSDGLRLVDAARTLCVRFRRPSAAADPTLTAVQARMGSVVLRGQACKGTTASDRDWRAGYLLSDPHRIMIYPPGMFRDARVKPIELQFVAGAS